MPWLFDGQHRLPRCVARVFGRFLSWPSPEATIAGEEAARVPSQHCSCAMKECASGSSCARHSICSMCFLCVQINCAATSLSYLNDRGAGPGDEGFSDALARVPRDNKNAWAREFSLPRERPPMPKRPIIARNSRARRPPAQHILPRCP